MLHPINETEIRVC